MSLWNPQIRRNIIILPKARIKIHKSTSKETSSCICHRASITLEAAVVLPLLTGFFVSLLFFFHVIRIQAVMEEALLYAGRKTAVESSVVEDEILLYASASGFFRYALREEPMVERYIKNGSYGIVLLSSNLNQADFTLRTYYKVQFPISLFGIDGIWMWNCGTFRKWIGDSLNSESENKDWVYITPTGEVYHATDSCRALRIQLHQTKMAEIEALRGENGQKYYACTRCVAENARDITVYYTDYGSLYHEKIDCTYIKRTIEKISRSEVGARRQCSYCY